MKETTIYVIYDPTALKPWKVNYEDIPFKNFLKIIFKNPMQDFNTLEDAQKCAEKSKPIVGATHIRVLNAPAEFDS